MAENTDMMIKVEADVAEAIRNIKELEKSLKVTQSTINNQLAPSTTTLGNKLQTVGGRISRFGASIKQKLGVEGALAFAAVGAAATKMAKSCIDAAIQSESQWKQFQVLLESGAHGAATNFGQTKTQITKFANDWGYAVSDIRSAGTTLLRTGMDSQQLSLGLQATAGVAARTGKSMEEASNLVSRALIGNGRDFERLTGIRLKDYKTADGQIDREKLLTDLYNTNSRAIIEHSNTTEAAVQRMNNNWNAFKKELGDALLPAVNIIADFAGKIAEGFKSLPTPVKQFIAAIIAITAVVGTVIGALGFLAPVITAIGAGISLLGTVFGSVVGFIGPVIASLAGVAATGGGLAGTFGVIATAVGGLLAPFASILIPIGAVIAAFAALYFVGASMGWWNDLGGMISKIGEALGWLAQQLTPVGQAFMWVGGQIAGFLGWIVRLFTDFNGATEQFNSFVSGLGDSIMNGIAGVWDWLGQSAANALRGLGDMIGNLFQSAMTSIMDGIRNAGGNFADAFNGLLDAGAKGAQQLVDGFMQGLGKLADDIKGFIPLIISTITDGLSNLGDSIAPGGGMVAGILGLVAPIPTLLFGAFERFGPEVGPAVQSFIMSIVNSFTSIGSSILQMFMSIPTQIGQFFMQLPMIIQQFLMNAILTVNMYILMIRTAIVARFLTLVMNVRMIWSMIVNAIRSRLMQARLIASNLASMLRNAIITRWNALVARVRQIFQNIVNQIRSRLSNAVSSARQKAQEIYQGIQEKVASIPQMVADEFNKIKDKVVNALNNVKTAAVSKISELVAAVKGALGIASPGYIQRMMTWEFNSLPGIVESGTSIATKQAAQGASNIVKAWRDNMETLSINMENARNITIPQIIPDAFNPQNNTITTRIDTNTPLFGGMRPQNTQNIQHHAGNTLIIEEINLDCNNLTQAQSKRVVWQAIQGVYEGL